MANPMIKFLKGTQEKFNGLSAYIDGVFYLTEDTHRLYIGGKDGTAALLNSAINVYASVDELPSTPPYTATDNDTFAYCAKENILAIYHYNGDSATEGHWIQINSDTQNKSVTNAITPIEVGEEGNKVVTGVVVSTTVTDRQDLSDSFSINEGDNINFTVDGKSFTINAVDEKATKAGHYTPEADTSDNSTDETISGTGFVTGVKIDQNGHVIGVTSSEQTTNNITGVVLGAATPENSANTVVLTSTVTDNVDSKSDSITFKGAGAVTISSSKDEKDANHDIITISSTDSHVTAAQYHYTPVEDENATKSASGGTVTSAKAQTPVITGIKTDGKGHITEVVSTQISDTHNTIKAVALTANNGVLSTSVEMNDGDSQSDTIALTINYGETGERSVATLQSDGTTEAGKWDLDVYTTAQVDAKIANAVGANGAVQIVGTLNAGAIEETATLKKVLPSGSEVKAGDTYVVVGAGTYDDVAATAGDMFIASKDDATAADFEWYYIPAGNEVIRMADSSENGFKFVEGNSNVTIGTVNFAKYDTATSDFQVVAEVETTSNTSNVSFNMYWGSF